MILDTFGMEANANTVVYYMNWVTEWNPILDYNIELRFKSDVFFKFLVIY